MKVQGSYQLLNYPRKKATPELSDNNGHIRQTLYNSMTFSMFSNIYMYHSTRCILVLSKGLLM